MQKSIKSKKSAFEKLHLVLNNASSKKNIRSENESYFKSLQRRLKRQPEKSIVYVHPKISEDIEQDKDFLKPEVKIYHKEEEKVIVFAEVKEEKIVEEEQKPEEEIVPESKEEELYEINKVEVKGPEFLEVKPKEITVKKEEELPTEEKELPEPEITEDVQEFKEITEEKEEEKPPEEIELPKQEITEDVEEFKETTVEKEEELPTEEKELPEVEIITEIEESKDIKSKEIPEWEPVDIKEAEQIELEEIKERKIEDKPKEELLLTKKEKEISPKKEKRIKEDVKEEFIIEKEEITETHEYKASEKVVFKDIKSIDEKTAKLLIENGITSVVILREIPIKKLTKIKGIKRKTAKKIKKEINEIDSKAFDEKPKDVFSKEVLEDNSFIEQDDEDLEEWESYSEDEIPQSQLKEIKGYKHKDYTLYKKEIMIGDKKRTVHFFSKGEPDEGEPIELPAGFKVKINKKTGVPYLKKKK